MTSDRAPRALEGLEDRLLSRFKWGLSADLQTPDFETRIVIIQKKLQAEGVYIDNHVIEYLAHSINTNVRELEGVIVSLMAQASLNRLEIDLDLAKKTLRNIIVDSEREVTIDSVQEAVASYFNVTIADLKAKSRKRELVHPRQVAMYLAKEKNGFVPEIHWVSLRWPRPQHGHSRRANGERFGRQTRRNPQRC